MLNKERIITTYENRIKEIREEYYKDKVTRGLTNNITTFP